MGHKNYKRPTSQTKLNLGTWNIKMLNGKEEEIAQEIEIIKFSVGLTGTKIKGKGFQKMTEKYCIY